MDSNYHSPFPPAALHGPPSMHLGVYPWAYTYNGGFNTNWGPGALSHNANQTMGGQPSMPGLAPTTNDHGCRCEWLTGGIPCNQAFADFDALMIHMGDVHDVKGSAARKLVCQWSTTGGCCGKEQRRDGFRRHIGTHVGCSVPCTGCGKSFSRKDSMRAHAKKKHDEN